MSAAAHARKQSAITFKVFVLWLCNQHYYTRDVIEMYRDLPYYEGMRAKTRYENWLHKNKHENHVNPLLPLEMPLIIVSSGP